MKLLELLDSLPSMTVEEAVEALNDNKKDIESVADIIKDLRSSYPNFADIRVRDLQDLQERFEELYARF